MSSVAEEGFFRFQHTMDVVRKKHRGQSGDKVTRVLVKAYVQFAKNNEVYYNLMYGSKSWHSTRPSDSLKTTARSILRTEIERLKRGQSRGQIAADVDVVRYAHMYWGTLHGISRLLLDGVYTGSESITKLCDSTADMLWGQLDPDPAT
ncbi:MAG: TetR-like C-terminal domain-containing protein [Pseudomonadota bacterium]